MRGSRLTGWRRIANAIWGPPNDPQIFGALDVDAAPLRELIDKARTAGHHLTPTHLVGRAVAHALAAVPELNIRLSGGRAIPRPSVDVFFITAVGGGHDLSGVKIEHADRRSAVAIADDLAERSRRLKAGDDPEFARTKRVMDRLPIGALELALRIGALVTQTWQRDVPRLGLHRAPFGSAMVSSVGMFGLPQGFAPLAWMYDVPFLVLAGELVRKPLVVDGRLEAREVLPLTATIDHRYVDGWHISRLMASFREYLAAPARFEPPFRAAVRPASTPRN